MNNAKQFSGENNRFAGIQYCYQFNQGKRTFFADADLSKSVEDVQANTQPPTVSTTSQLGKIPIYLVRIIYHSRNYPDYHFLTHGFSHSFKLKYVGPSGSRTIHLSILHYLNDFLFCGQDFHSSKKKNNKKNLGHLLIAVQ